MQSPKISNINNNYNTSFKNNITPTGIEITSRIDGDTRSKSILNSKIKYPMLANDMSLTNFDSGIKTPSVDRIPMSPNMEKCSMIGDQNCCLSEKLQQMKKQESESLTMEQFSFDK